MSVDDSGSRGRSMLVTGGTGYLGTEVVLAHLAAGDSCTVTHIREGERARLQSAVQTRLGAAALDRLDLVRCELTDPLQVESLVSRAAEHFGPPTVASLLAGGWAGGQPLAQAPAGEWSAMARMNTDTLWNVLRALLPGMVTAGGGSLVAVGSRAALEGGPGSAAYAASKAAVVALVKSAAAEYRDFGVRLNCVLPSTLDTPANRRAMPAADFSAWVPLEQLAATLLWLHTPAAASISGAALPVYHRA